MSEIWQRILIAAFLSIAGCLITYTLTTSSQLQPSHSPNEEPIAIIVSSENEVQRRLSERLVWRKIFDNQYLYAGEAIRTAVGSTATLEFIGQKTIVQLDPETVIEIEKNANGVNLDFLKGNLFIKSEELQNKFTLSAGGKTLEINNAEVSLAKTDVNSNVQVEVSKGEVKGADQSEQRIEVLAPLPRQVFYLNPDEIREIEIRWKKLASEYIISAELGESPQRLTKISDLQVDPSGARFIVPLKAGRYYIRLLAIDSSGKLPSLSSFTRRIDLRAKLSPITLQPSKNSKVQAFGQNPEIEFSWANPGMLENLIVEYARSQDLRVDYGSERVKSKLSTKLTLRWNTGDIFWRVSGTLPGTKVAVSSKISKFTLQSEAVATPTLAVATPTPMPSPSPSPIVQISPTPSLSPSPTIQVVEATLTPTPTPVEKKTEPTPAVSKTVKKDEVGKVRAPKIKSMTVK